MAEEGTSWGIEDSCRGEGGNVVEALTRQGLDFWGNWGGGWLEIEESNRDYSRGTLEGEKVVFGLTWSPYQILL